MLEYLLPFQQLVDVTELLQYVAPTDETRVAALGLNTYSGKARFTTDRQILSQMDLSGLPKPGLVNISDEDPEPKWDALGVKPLDKYEFSQMIYLEYHGGSKPDEVTILPVEFKMRFYLGLRRGIGSMQGPSQEVAWVWDGPVPVFVNLHPCQKVKADNTLVGEDDWTTE